MHLEGWPCLGWGKMICSCPTPLCTMVMVQLKLPKNLRRIHPMFHCSLLKSKVILPLCPPPPLPPVPIFIEGEQHIEVKEILDSRKHKGKVQYLIAWKHFPASQSEWVDGRHISQTFALLPPEISQQTLNASSHLIAYLKLPFFLFQG